MEMELVAQNFKTKNKFLLAVGTQRISCKENEEEWVVRDVKLVCVMGKLVPSLIKILSSFPYGELSVRFYKFGVTWWEALE